MLVEEQSFLHIRAAVDLLVSDTGHRDKRGTPPMQTEKAIKTKQGLKLLTTVSKMKKKVLALDAHQRSKVHDNIKRR